MSMLLQMHTAKQTDIQRLESLIHAQPTKAAATENADRAQKPADMPLQLRTPETQLASKESFSVAAAKLNEQSSQVRNAVVM